MLRARRIAATRRDGIRGTAGLGLRFARGDGLRRLGLTAYGGPDAGEMVVAVAHGVIFQHELAGEGCVAVERNGGGAIQILIAEGANGCCGRSTVGCQQGERRFPGGIGMFIGVIPVHGGDAVPGNTGNGLAFGEEAGELDLNGIHTGYMVDDYADLPPGRREGASAIRIPESEEEKAAKALAPASRRAASASDLEVVLVSAVADCMPLVCVLVPVVICVSSNLNGDPQESGGNEGAAVPILILGFGKFQELARELFFLPVFFGGFERVHGGSIKLPEG